MSSPRSATTSWRWPTPPRSRSWTASPDGRTFLKGVAGSWEVAIPLEGLGGLEAEKARLEKEIKKADEEIDKLEGRLQKKDFLERAPQAVVDETKGNLAGLREKKAKLEASLALLRSEFVNERVLSPRDAARGMRPPGRRDTSPRFPLGGRRAPLRPSRDTSCIPPCRSMHCLSMSGTVFRAMNWGLRGAIPIRLSRGQGHRLGTPALLKTAAVR